MTNNKSIVKKIMRCVYPFGACVLASISSSNAYSACSYVVNSQWDGGFNATIKITNNGSAVVSSWSVNWQYAGQDRVAGAYNANFTGSNPYTASNLGWNGSLPPGQAVEFGLNGSKGSAAAEIPALVGTLCGAISSSSKASSSVASSSSNIASSSSSSAAISSTRSSSSSSKIVSSSVSSSSLASSSKPSSSSVTSIGLSTSSSSISSSIRSSLSSSNSSVVGGIGNWALDSVNSYLSFTTTKNINTVESHTFATITGSIASNGVATLVIDLNSVDTANAIRDGRMRGLLFEVANFPNATVTLNLATNQLSSIPVGSSTTQEIAASLNLHGVSGNINTKVSIQKLSATRIQVQSLSPVIINAPDYSLANGVEELRKAVNIESISTAVPVNFVLFYNAQ